MGVRPTTRFLICIAAAWMPPTSAPAGDLVRPARSESVQARSAHAAERLARVKALVEDSNAPDMVGRQRWRRLLQRHRETIEASRTHPAFTDAINAIFEATGQSHFRYFADHQWAYYLMRSYFFRHDERVMFEHIGLYTKNLDGRWFVRSVLEGSPAAETTIRTGDELLTVDGGPFHPVASFRGKEGVPVELRLRRRPGLAYRITVTPVEESLYEAVRKATRRSIRVIEENGARLLYMHGWALLGNGGEYDRLLELQPEVDGLLLDYRDGVGGSSGRAKRFLLGGKRPSSSRRGRHWSKPVVILTADGTRSAKEEVVDAVQKAHRAPLVGQPTPGAVTAAIARRVGKDGLIMLPVSRRPLEGKPTQPDVHIPRDIRYTAGADPQLRAGRQILRQLIRRSHEN